MQDLNKYLKFWDTLQWQAAGLSPHPSLEQQAVHNLATTSFMLHQFVLLQQHQGQLTSFP